MAKRNRKQYKKKLSDIETALNNLPDLEGLQDGLTMTQEEAKQLEAIVLQSHIHLVEAAVQFTNGLNTLMELFEFEVEKLDLMTKLIKRAKRESKRG